MPSEFSFHADPSTAPAIHAQVAADRRAKMLARADKRPAKIRIAEIMVALGDPDQPDHSCNEQDLILRGIRRAELTESNIAAAQEIATRHHRGQRN
ncbi:hypothetical protein [Aliihoeflea sp. PC F10.4]